MGFNYSQQVLKSKSRNKLSTLDHPAVVEANIHNELTLGCLAYIQNPTNLPRFHASPIGIIQKSIKKWRMIVDLSAPEGHSINDGIEKALCSISYISVDNVAKTILQLGPGTSLGKMDAQELPDCPYTPVRQDSTGYSMERESLHR